MWSQSKYFEAKVGTAEITHKVPFLMKHKTLKY